MIRKLFLIFALIVLVSLFSTGSLFLLDQQVSAGTERGPIQIEWTDLGEEALYPGFSGISEGQSVVLDNKLYVFGGYAQCCFPIRKAYVFDPAQNGWSLLRDLPQGTTHTGIATDGKDIYLAGGYVEDPANNYRIVGYEKFRRYNVASDTYTSLPNLPKKASTGQLVYLDGKLHYIGGTTPTEGDEDFLPDLPDHFVFDLDAYAVNPATTNWVDMTAVAPLPNPRQHAGAVVLNGFIYYVGGQKFHNDSLIPQGNVHRYNPQSQVWEEMAAMPEARNHMSNTIIVSQGKIIVLGGQYNHEDARSDVFSYDPLANTWSELTPLPLQQFSAIGGVINGEIYFGTGAIGYSKEERRRMRKGIFIIDGTPVPTDIPNTTATHTPTPSTPTTPGVPVSEELLVNGSFELDTDQDKQPNSWVLKNGFKDKRKCNTAGKPMIAFDGQCAYQFKGDGVTPENAVLKQSVNVAAFDFQPGDQLVFGMYIDTTDLIVVGQVKTIVKYSDGSARNKLVVDLSQTSSYEFRSEALALASASIEKIKVKVKHTNMNGKLRIDAASLLWTRGVTQQQPLALPSPQP